MAKMIGLSRSLKLQWLNKVVELVMQDLTESEIKEQLNKYLGFEITSPTVIRKTREILMNIWVYENDYSGRLKGQALTLIQSYPENATEIHWCMMLATYPVFVDVCKLIGKMAEFQDEITLAQLKQKLFDEWGERTTLLHSIDKLIATLKNMDTLVSDKPGKYHINKHKVNNADVVSFMVYTIMCIDNSGYYSLIDLKSSKYFFPFEYQIEKKILLADDRFVMNNFGGTLSIALNDRF